MPRKIIETISKNIIDTLSSLEAFNIGFSSQHEKIFNDKLLIGLGLGRRNIPGLGLIPDASYNHEKDIILIEIGHNGLYQEPINNINKAYRDIEKWNHLNCKIFTIQIIEDVIKINPIHITRSKYYYYNKWGKGINYFLNNRTEVSFQKRILDREFNNIDSRKLYYKSKIYSYQGTEIQFHMIITGPHIGNSASIKRTLPYLK